MQPIQNDTYYPFGTSGLYAKIVRSMGLPVAILAITILIAIVKGSAFFASTFGAGASDALGFVVPVGIGLAVALALIDAFIAWLRYVNNTFMVSDNALYLRNGILQRREISVPFRHMSNILQQQSIFDRIMGVCRCQIEIQADEIAPVTTATSVPDDVVLYDVDMGMIGALRELLLSRSNTQRMVVVNNDPSKNPA